MTVKNGDFDEAAQNVINLIAEGQSLTAALIASKTDIHVFNSVVSRVPELNQKYIRAKELRADLMADEVVNVASNFEVNPLHNRNLVDAMKWRAGKLSPRVYGDAINVNVEEKVNCVDTLTEARRRYKQLVVGLQKGITIDNSE